MRRTASEIIHDLEIRIARLERTEQDTNPRLASSRKARLVRNKTARHSERDIQNLLNDAEDLEGYPEIRDLDNIVDALSYMMRDGRVPAGEGIDLEKATGELEDLSSRYPIGRKDAITLEKMLDILLG
jgi:hypothetical protein